MLSAPHGGVERRKNLPASVPISIPSISNIPSNHNLDWSLPPSSPLSPLNSHHTASPPTDLPVDIRPGSPTSLLSVPMPTTTSAGGGNRLNPTGSSPLSPLSPTPSIDLSSPETIQFALPSDIEAEHSQSDGDEKEMENEGDKQSWHEGPQGYASDSPSGFKMGRQRRIVPPLLMLNHKRSSSSSLAQRPTSVSASSSPLATHSRFHSQSNTAAFTRDSFIDLEDTLEGGALSNPNAMYPPPPKRHGGLFRHKQSGSLRSIASASSLLPTFADPSGCNTNYQALAPPSPGLNVPFGGGVVIHSPSASMSPSTSHAWKVFSRDKDKDKLTKKKDFPWRSNSDESPAGGGVNISSTSSSPTCPSAPALKPPKSKQHKKGKSKSNTHPFDNPSSSAPVLALSSHPPPTTNNLDPATRQDLIKKHRKLAKVLGEEPRVVGNMEFIGGSKVIPGQAGFASTTTSSSSISHPHHHYREGSGSSSTELPNANSLGTFFHLHRKQKNRDKDDWESGWEDENKWINKAKGGKGKSQVRITAEVRGHGTQGTTHAERNAADYGATTELVSVLDQAYQQVLYRDPASSSSLLYDHDATGGYQPKRRHSTPVTSEFFIEDVPKDTAGGNRNNAAKKSGHKDRIKVKDRHAADVNNKTTIAHPPDPILISPTSPVPSAPTMRSSKDSVLGSPTMSSPFFTAANSLLLDDSLAAASDRNQQEVRVAAVTRSPFISPPSSPPPILPPLTTSPPRLIIDPDFFQNPNPLGSTSASNSGFIPSLRVDMSQLKEESLKLNLASAPKGTQEHQDSHSQTRGHGGRNRDPDASPLASQAVLVPTSDLAPSVKSQSFVNLSRPSTPHPVVNLRDPAFDKATPKEGGNAESKVTPLVLDKLGSPLSSPPISASIFAATTPATTSPSTPVSGETISKSRHKDRSKDKTRRTPVGPATFSVPAPTPTTTVLIGVQEKGKDRKIKTRPDHLRARSKSPESFMDFGDDEIETGGGGGRDSGSGVTSDGEGKVSHHHQVRRSQTAPNAAGLFQFPLSAPPVLPSSTSPIVNESKVKATTDLSSVGIPSSSSASLAPERGLEIHRTPSMTSLTPSLSSLLSSQTTSTSTDDIFHPYSQVSHSLSFEQDKRKKMDKLAKLSRFLGDPVPIELVLGESYLLKNDDLPAFALANEVSAGGLASTGGGSRRPLWMRRRRSSSSAALPGYEEIDRRKDDLDPKERIRYVRRGAKMEQMFGTRPPPDLYQIHTPRGAHQQPPQGYPALNTVVANSQDGPVTSPTSPTFQPRAQPKGNMNSSSYKGKSRYSALGYSTLANNSDVLLSSEPVVGGVDYAYASAHLPTSGTYGATSSLGRSQSKSKGGKSYAPLPLPLLFTPSGSTGSGLDVSLSLPKRPGTGDSNKPLLAFGQDIPTGGRLSDQSTSKSPGQLDTDNGSFRSSVYMQYRQSLISLGDIVDKDDRASLAELRQYLQPPHSASHTGLGHAYVFGGGGEYNSDESYDEDEDEDDDDENEARAGPKLKRFSGEYKDDALATPTQLTPSGSRSPNTPNSAKAGPSLSPPLTRRRSLPSRASTLSLVSTLSGTSTLSSLSTLSMGTSTITSANIPGYYNAPRTEAEGRADMFRARRRRAAKLTNFFGVKYRDLFGEVLESIEAGMREDVRVGRMGVGELEELMMRVKKLRLRRGQVN